MAKLDFNTIKTYLKNNVTEYMEGAAGNATIGRHAASDYKQGLKKAKIAANADANKSDIVQSIMQKGRDSKRKFINDLVPGEEVTGKVFQEVNKEAADFADVYTKAMPKGGPKTGNDTIDAVTKKMDDYYREIANSTGKRQTVIDPDGTSFDIVTGGNGTGKAGYHREKSGFEKTRDYFGHQEKGRSRKIAAGAGIGAVAIGAGVIDHSLDGEGGLGGATLGATAAGAGIYGAIASAARRL